MGDDTSYEEHVAVTNSRLSTMRMSLSDVTTFSQACRELTIWCEDQRAFTAHFEDNLLATLQVAMENGTKEAFDFTLTHTLINTCFPHRKHLSKESAIRINRWYEQLRRMKKNGGKRKRAPPKSQQQSQQNSAGSSGNAIKVENNNFMMVDDSQSTSMWPPGSSTATTPGVYPAGPGTANGYGMMQQQQQQMSYTQISEFEKQRMIAMRHQQQQMAAAGYPTQQMPPMGLNQVPGQTQPLVRFPYVHGQPGMPNGYPNGVRGGPQQQPPQSLRTPAPSVFGQMPQANPHKINMQHNNGPPNSNMMPDHAIDNMPVYTLTHGLVEEMTLQQGTMGSDFFVGEEAFKMLQSPHYDVLCATWQTENTFEMSSVQVFINGQSIIVANGKLIMNQCFKQTVNPGQNSIQISYNAAGPYHRLSCDFIVRKTIAEVRNSILEQKDNQMANIAAAQTRHRYYNIANSSPHGFMKFSLACPMSNRRMRNPVTHRGCMIGLAFELTQLLANNQCTTRYACPYCKKFFKLTDVEIDYFVGNCLHQFSGMPHVTEVMMDRQGNVTAVPEEKPVPAPPPKKGKKRQTKAEQAAAAAAAQAQAQAQAEAAFPIKRVKSEGMSIKHEPMFDGFSPMSMMNIPSNDWPKMQSPNNGMIGGMGPMMANTSHYGIQSPNKVALGPATPATPSVVLHNPASVGSSSQFNLCSPRAATMVGNNENMCQAGGSNGGNHATTSGSAPYTPTSVASSLGDLKLDSLELEELFLSSMKGGGNVMDNERALRHYLRGTKNEMFQNIDIKCLEDTSNLLNKPPSNGTPQWDDLRIGSK